MHFRVKVYNGIECSEGKGSFWIGMKYSLYYIDKDLTKVQ